MKTPDGTTKNPLPISHIQGMQTIVPKSVTYPRSSCHINTDVIDTYLCRQRCHIILFYKNTNIYDSGSAFAGHAKESMGRAMEQQPIIAGRLRRPEEGEKAGDDVAMEIVSNDCGARLVEARIQVALSEFLELKDREEAEAQLVFWKDLEEENLQLCPLLYVQVTNFQGGGYSVGISCSLLLADPSTITNFLMNWAKIHTKMISENYFKKLPIFYLPNLMAANTISQITSDPIKNRNNSIIFTTPKKILSDNNGKELMSICIQEAENELGIKATMVTRLFSATTFEKTTLRKYFREPVACKKQDKLDRMNWDHFGANEISFCEGSKPICVSNWIYSPPGEVLAILIPSYGDKDSLMSVVVSVPN